MSKVKNLPEITSLDNDDLLYAVDTSVGTNGGRKITKSNLKTSVAPTAAEIKTAYESNPNTNAFTDAEKTKLGTVETGATADQSAAEVPFNNSSNGFTATQVQAAIEEVNTKASAEFRATIISGRIIRIAAGNARFDGVFFSVAQTDLLLDPSLTNGTVYVDTDGSIKVTASNVAAPAYTIVVARASTDLSSVLSLEDRRVKNALNLIRGLIGDVKDVRAGAAADAGSTGRVSDAGHKHNIITAAPASQSPNAANAEGVSPSLARADHNHLIPTAVPTATLAPSSTNSEGAGVAFARDSHTHAIATGLDADTSTILPNDTAAAGAVDKFAKAAHKHAIATAAPAATLAPSSANAEGAGNNFARSTHVHQFAVALDADVSTIVPNDTAATGAVDKFAKAAHKHAIATAAPSTNLKPSSTNDEGTGNNFARATHSHAHDMSADGDVSTILPNDTASAGAVDKFSKAGHKHAIATAAAVALTPDMGNAEGAGNNFARATHTHNVPTAAPVNTGIANSAGVLASFAKSDHIHNTTISNSSIRSTTSVNTSSATDVVITGLTLTPGAGTYLVLFEGAATDSNNTATMTFSIYANAVQVTNSERAYVPTNAITAAVHTFAVITVAAAQAIDVRYRTSAGTVTINGRSLTLIRLGD